MAQGIPASLMYNPTVFAPNNKPLLDKGQWSMVQLFLNDARRLPTTEQQFPDARAIPIFNAVRAASSHFELNTLPRANQLGNQLYNYGTTADATFRGVIQLMDQPSPNKDALRQLFGNVRDTAQRCGTEASAVEAAVKDFGNELDTGGRNLKVVVDRELTDAGGLKARIELIQNDIKTQDAAITAAQAAITADQRVINDTVYYSWIPFIGTIVAVSLIIANEKDIQEKLGIINAAVAKKRTDNNDLAPLNTRLTQLTYCQQFNGNQISQMAKMAPILGDLRSAWSTMATNLGNILQNINLAEANQLKSMDVLAPVQLTAAVNQWQQVANDAHSYMMNFYVRPVEELPKAA
jgi:hypothetical protein